MIPSLKAVTHIALYIAQEVIRCIPVGALLFPAHRGPFSFYFKKLYKKKKKFIIGTRNNTLAKLSKIFLPASTSNPTNKKW